MSTANRKAMSEAGLKSVGTKIDLMGGMALLLSTSADGDAPSLGRLADPFSQWETEAVNASMC
jgi:hypothetical protein